MNTKRATPLFAALALIAAGCGNDGDGDGTMEDATTEPAGPAATAPPDASPSATTLGDADTTAAPSTTTLDDADTTAEDAVEEAADAEDADAEAGEWAGPTIPFGTYTKVMTADEALAELAAVGVSEATATQVVVDEIASDEVEITFRIDDGVWAQFMTWRGNHDSLSARGVYTYTEEGEWAIAEDPCPDELCEAPPLTWTFADNVLTLNADTAHALGGPPAADWAEVRDFFLELDDEWFFANVFLIFNGEFEKVE